MSSDLLTLIWLFPIAFMFHDFEEIILGERWFSQNAGEIENRLKNRVPAFVASQISAVLGKSTAELAFPVSLIFALTVAASFLAAQYQQYGFFLLATGAFFLHGFMHIGQSVLLRRYVPAVISSVFIVIPYGVILYPRLIEADIVDLSGLLIVFLLAVVLTIPFILVMHVVGDYLYQQTIKRLLA